MHVFIMSIYDIYVIIIYIVHNTLLFMSTQNINEPLFYEGLNLLWSLLLNRFGNTLQHIWCTGKGLRDTFQYCFLVCFWKKIFLIFNRKENGKMWQWISSCILDHSSQWAGQVETVNVFSQLSDISDWKFNWLVLNHYLICFLVKNFWSRKLSEQTWICSSYKYQFWVSVTNKITKKTRLRWLH